MDLAPRYRYWSQGQNILKNRLQKYMMEMLGMVQLCEKLDPGVICKQVAGLTNLFDKCVDKK